MNRQQTPLWAAVAAVALAAVAPASAQDSPADRAIDFADACFVRGEYDLAADGYTQYLEKFPDGAHRAEALYRLGESEYQRDRFKEAEKSFKTYVDGFPDHEHRVRALFRLGEIAHDQGRYGEAVGPLSAAAAGEAEPALLEAALYYLGSTYAALENWDKAREMLARCVARTDSRVYRVVAGVQLIDVALRQQDQTAARRQIADLLALPSASKTEAQAMALGDRHLLRLADQSARIGDATSGMVCYERLLADFPASEFADQAAIGIVSSLYNSRRFADVVRRGQALQSRFKDAALAAENRFLVGVALYEQGQYADASAQLASLVTSPGTPADLVQRARYRLVWSAFRENDWAGVITHGKPFIAAAEPVTDAPPNGDAADVIYLMAQSHIKLGQPAEAAAQFQQLLERFPDTSYRADALLQLGWCRLSTGDHAAAVATLEGFVASNPGHPQLGTARRYLAEALVAGGEHQRALAVYEEAIAAAEQSGAKAALPELYLNLAASCYQLQDFDRLAATYEKLLAVAPDHPRRAEAEYWLGYQRQTAKRYDEAIAHLQRVVDAPGDLPAAQLDDTLLRLAVCSYQTGDATAAVDRMVALLRRDTSVAVPLEFLTWTATQLSDSERWPDAEYVYDRMATRYPREDVLANAYVERGHCRLKMGEPQRALELFEAFFKDLSTPAYLQRAHLGHGEALAALGRHKEAILSFEKVDGTGDDPEALALADLGRARSYEAQGEWDAAYGSYLRVWALYDMVPECPQAAAGCIRAASALNSPERVDKAREELLQRYPDSPEARALR